MTWARVDAEELDELEENRHRLHQRLATVQRERDELKAWRDEVRRLIHSGASGFEALDKANALIFKI